MKHLPMISAGDIGCSLSADELDVRRGEFGSLVSHMLRAPERINLGVRIRLRSDDETMSSLRQLAAKEGECCSFLHFDIARTPEEIVVSITAAQENPLFDALAGLDPALVALEPHTALP